MEGGSEGGEPRVKRKMKTPFQLEVLEKTYAVDSSYPSEQVRAKLSVQLNLTERELKKWFDNRRMKDRKKPLVKRSKKVGYNMAKTTERPWRYPNDCIPKKKRNQRRKLRDVDDVDVLLDPKQRHCELVENVAPTSDSLLDGDVEFLVPKQEQCELAENVSPMSDSLEKFSSCQSDTVCVQGYKVKRSIATILEAIFKKHGDIAANCVFKTSSTRTHFLEAVCEVVRQIQTNAMTEMGEDIEFQVSDAEAANINVSWIRAHFEAFHKRKEISKRYSLLLEMKSNSGLVKRAAQRDLRERCAELVAAQDRFEKAERCVRVLHLVTKNLHDNILESKAELHSWVEHPVV